MGGNGNLEGASAVRFLQRVHCRHEHRSFFTVRHRSYAVQHLSCDVLLHFHHFVCETLGLLLVTFAFGTRLQEVRAQASEYGTILSTESKAH